MMTILLSMWFGFVCWGWGYAVGRDEWRGNYDECMKSKTFSKPEPKNEPVYLEDMGKNYDEIG